MERYVRSDAPAPIGYYYEPGQSVAGRSVCIDGRRVGVSGFAIIASRGDGPVGSVSTCLLLLSQPNRVSPVSAEAVVAAFDEEEFCKYKQET